MSFIEWIVRRLTRKRRLLIGHHTLLKAYGTVIVATAGRVERLFELHAMTMKTVAGLGVSEPDRKELLDCAAQLESESDAMRSQIEQFSEALKAL